MSLVNNASIIGNLGQDPEIRTLESGVSVAKFSVATNERYKDKEGNKKTHTEWHNVQLWRGLAEVAQKYLKKGSKVAIKGMLRTRKWEDKGGVSHYTTDIVGQEIELLDSNGSNDNKFAGIEDPLQSFPPKTTTEGKEPSIPDMEGVDDDLPF